MLLYKKGEVRVWIMKHFKDIRFCRLRSRCKLLMFLVLTALLIFGNFVIQKLIRDDTTFPAAPAAPAAPAWLNSTHVTYSKLLPWTQGNDALVIIFPHSAIEEENKTVQELSKHDESALWKLSEFLDSKKEVDGATCLRPPSTRTKKGHEQVNTATGNISLGLESSWCRFIKRKWSLNIRNTGPVQKLKLRKLNTKTSFAKNFAIEKVIVFQNCNILQGPFVIRKTVFDRIGGLLDNFGKATLLEFFLRSEGELKMAKLTNCTWTREITHEDRGTLEGAKFPEYASFGNKHQILRIVTPSRIEWTTCAATWKLCQEKPYVKPRSLPSIAAPICCSAVLGQILVDFTRALEKLGLEYRVVYGTLLGAVRSQAIIPWTYDVDFAISSVNESMFAALRKELGGLYYAGDSFAGTLARGHMLMPPYIEVDTAPFYDGPDDLEGNALFSDEIQEAVLGLLPVSDDWRTHGYVDFYEGEPHWMSDSSLVIINNQTYITVKDVDYELEKWYGKNYLKPAFQGEWSGQTD